jgi:hypothetical protein
MAIQAPKEKKVSRWATVVGSHRYKLWLKYTKIRTIKKLRGTRLCQRAQAKTTTFTPTSYLIAKMPVPLPNPTDTEKTLKRSLREEQLEVAHPPQPILPEDSAVTKAEEVERNGVSVKEHKFEEPSAKRIKMEEFVEGMAENGRAEKKLDSRDKVKGIALVKPE